MPVNHSCRLRVFLLCPGSGGGWQAPGRKRVHSKFTSIRKMLSPVRRVDEASRYSLRSGRRRRPLFLACAFAALISASAAVYFALQPAPSGPATYSTNNSAAGTGRTAPADGASAAAGTPSKVEGNPPSDTKSVTLNPRNPAHVAAWEAGKGGAALTSISEQLGTVLMAHGSSQYTVMRQACVRLASAVAVANESAQIPDAAMGRLYERARTLLAAGAAGCEAGIVSQREGVEDMVTHT